MVVVHLFVRLFIYYCVMNNFSKKDEVVGRINNSIKKLFSKCGNKPMVCIVCDQFCGLDWVLTTKKLLHKNSDYFKCEEKLPSELMKSYRYAGYGYETWMGDCMFSSKAVYDCDLRSFVTCCECNASLKRNCRPIKSISNGWFFGSCPEVLRVLTDAEIAFITPVKNYGYCFSYVGGKHMKLKGTLGYFKLEESDIVNTVEVASDLSKLINTNIIFIATGDMTKEQKAKVLNKSEIRPEFVKRAVVWLIEHNRNWAHVKMSDVDGIIEKNKPMFVDLCKEEKDTNTQGTVEDETETLLQVYFPDGTMTNVYGGLSSSKKLQASICRVQASTTLQGTLLATKEENKQFVQDYADNNFVKSCILQMPYGRGGIDENRVGRNDDVLKVEMHEYAKHLSMLSDPNFHRPLFVLKLFNMKLRSCILKSSFQKINGNRFLHDLRSELSLVDFSRVAKQLDNDEYDCTGNCVTKQVIGSIQAISRGLPHTDEAARRARQYMNVMQHHFGLGGVFLTVTPDDENSFLVSCFSQMDKDGDLINIDSLSYETLKQKAKLRRDVRLNYPGIAALNFEYMLDIVIREVIGWDVKNCKPTATPGLFGVPYGYGGAVEEQGRGSCHVHFVVFLRGFRECIESLELDSNYGNMRSLGADICGIVDNAISTNLIGEMDENTCARTFDHPCMERDVRKRKRPVIVDEQQIRNLRSLQYTRENRVMAYCIHCGFEWTGESMVREFLHKRQKLEKVDVFPDENHYLTQLCYEYTKPNFAGTVNPSVVHAKTSVHASKHCESCFKCSSTMRKNDVSCQECRMHLPDLPRKKTAHEELIVGETNNEVSMFDWTGKLFKKKFFTFQPKRSEYDLYMNTYIGAVGESKIGGNSNGRIITPGPIGLYTIKYPTKKTQEQNSKPYENVLESLTKAMNTSPKTEDAKRNSLSLIIRGGFAANKENLIGASQAAFLIRNQSRFLWSHEFAFVPVQELCNVLTGKSITGYCLRSFNGTPYADVQALHYLCRPLELEGLCAMHFWERYEVVRKTSKNKKGFLELVNTQYFEHPSKVHNCLAVRQRFKQKLGWISHMGWVDTAEFKGEDILSSSSISNCMEQHAMNVLVLCTSYRKLEDLQIDGSYVLKLRDIFKQGSLNQYKNFLQNVQDCAYNFGRVRRKQDKLESRTNAYKEGKEDVAEGDTDEGEDVKDDDKVLDGEALDQFLGESETLLDMFDEKSVESSRRINFTRIQNRGSFACGIKGLCNIENKDKEEQKRNFINCNGGIIDDNSKGPGSCKGYPAKPTRQKILSVLLEKANSWKSMKSKFSDKTHNFPDANGSAISIVNWARIAGLDKDQSRAFEVFASSFVLSFYRDADSMPIGDRLRDVVYLREKLRLGKLAGRVPTNCTRSERFRNENLVCFLHGPGGSGKSAVIDLLMEYAKLYCTNVEEEFNQYTIVVTALSGVAATIINGRTVHSATHMNKNLRNIPPEEKEKWKHTRLLIIDEISFASKEDLQKIARRVRFLKDVPNMTFGGIDVILCGDLRQLEPVASGTPIYESIFQEFHGSVNCFLELKGMHRFKDDLEWGMLLFRLRNGEMTHSDIDKINTRVVKDFSTLPNNIRYATFRNIDRASINLGLFHKHLKNQEHSTINDAVLILPTNLEVRTGVRTYRRVTDSWEHHFLSSCGEGDCKPTGHCGRFDPALLLYYNRPIMVNCNENVLDGIANGTRATVKSIELVNGKSYFYVTIGNTGKQIPALRAADIKHIVLEHEIESAVNKTFVVEPKEHTFIARVPYPENLQPGGKKELTQSLHMRAIQMPIICNNATTGHKLQGSSVENLFIHSWTILRNWTYVVLSRVKTITGLYLRRPLEKKNLDIYNEIPENLRTLLRDMRESAHYKSPLQTQDYENIFNTDMNQIYELN